MIINFTQFQQRIEEQEQSYHKQTDEKNDNHTTVVGYHSSEQSKVQHLSFPLLPLQRQHGLSYL